MSDNPQHPRDDEQNDPTPDGSTTDEAVSASVMFMEMMREAAARAADGQASQVSDAVDEAIAPEAVNAAQVQQQRQAALNDQRVRRVQRRRARRRHNTVSVLGGIIRSVIVVGAAAGLVATIFTWWTPSEFIDLEVRQELSIAMATDIVTLQPTPVPVTPNWMRRIGIVSGHRGPEDDPGAVCPDGLTEAEINFDIATRVVRQLRDMAYTVDLLDEFDPRLQNYEAAALVSLHSNTCQDFGDEVISGYLISAAAARVTARGHDDILVDCIGQHYAQTTGLQRREGLTVDMTDYHTFREIHPRTPAAILELGFMFADRELLTQEQERITAGIIDGILCFLEPGAPRATMTPSPAPVAATPEPLAADT